MMTEASRQCGRHRRARGDWWREPLWLGMVVAVIVWQALRQWQRERTSVPAAEPAAGNASALVDRAPRGSGHDSPRAGAPGVQLPLSSGAPIPGLSPELLASWALRRAYRGGVAKSGDHYFDRGHLMLSHLTGALDELVEGGMLTLAPEDTWGLRRVSLTAAGHDQYPQLSCPPRRVAPPVPDPQFRGHKSEVGQGTKCGRSVPWSRWFRSPV